jgi:hypothetical protein
VVFSTLRTFLADNAGIGLPLGIERVIGIGSKTQGDSWYGLFCRAKKVAISVQICYVGKVEKINRMAKFSK